MSTSLEDHTGRNRDSSWATAVKQEIGIVDRRRGNIVGDMGRRSQVFGICRVCGEHRHLTREHIPPRSAFNDATVRIIRGDDILKEPWGEFEVYEVSQAGFWVPALCERCNNDTGAWYGAEYARWAHSGLVHAVATNGQPTLFYGHRIMPLRVVKQVLSMFLSISPPGFGDAFPELRRFVLQRRLRGLPPEIGLYAYYNLGPNHRACGPSAFGDFGKGSVRVSADLSTFPIGYVMTIDSAPPDRRLQDIKHFAKYSYDEFAEVCLRLRLLPINTPFPGDFRTEGEVEADVEANRRAALAPREADSRERVASHRYATRRLMKRLDSYGVQGNMVVCSLPEEDLDHMQT